MGRSGSLSLLTLELATAISVPSAGTKTSIPNSTIVPYIRLRYIYIAHALSRISSLTVFTMLG
jgi:hypothetical protein